MSMALKYHSWATTGRRDLPFPAVDAHNAMIK
jgi:hypothetical protein